MFYPVLVTYQQQDNLQYDMNNILKISLTLIVSCIFYTVTPQDRHTLSVSVYNNQAKLRWAPKSFYNWKIGIDNGYCLQRFLINPEFEQRVLEKTDTIRVPEYLKWKQIVDTSDAAAIVAQAIFGDNFETINDESSIFKIIDVSREQELRYSYSMLMAAQNFELACFMGLGTKQKIDSTKYYLFKLFVLQPDTTIVADTARVIISPFSKRPLPIINDIYCSYSVNNVQIRWPKTVNNDYFVGYYIERSTDSINFKQLNNTLFVPIDDNNKNSVFYFNDTVSVVGNNYYYRIRGINAFGEYSSYSNIGSVATYNQLTENPVIDSVYFTTDKKIKVVWHMPKNADSTCLGYNVLVSEKISTGYNNINNKLLPPQQRSFVVEPVGAANYIIVAAYDLGQKPLFSLPSFIQCADSTPPLPPKGLKSITDSTGTMHLTWDKNTEKDIAGYRVFFSDNLNSEFSKISDGLIADNKFSYKFPMNWLNQYIYIKIIAEDKSFNYSKFSDVIKVKLNDTIKPSEPVINYYQSTDNGIEIGWVNSSSFDLSHSCLVKKWQQNIDTLVTFNDNQINTFCDNKILPNTEYTYFVVAADSSGNKSVSGKILVKAKFKPLAIELLGYADTVLNGIVLQWQNSNQPIKQVVIYKALPGNKLNLYKTIIGNQNNWCDNNVTINNTYTYRIKVLYANGKSSFSKPIDLKF